MEAGLVSRAVASATSLGVALNLPVDDAIEYVREACEALQYIQSLCDSEDANIILGTVVDAAMEDQVRITVLATGFSPVINLGGGVTAAGVLSTSRPRLSWARLRLGDGELPGGRRDGGPACLLAHRFHAGAEDRSSRLGGQNGDARTDDPNEQRRGDGDDDLTFEREEALRDHEGGEERNVGEGTDSTEQGRMMWARVKGRTENELLRGLPRAELDAEVEEVLDAAVRFALESPRPDPADAFDHLYATPVRLRAGVSHA